MTGLGPVTSSLPILKTAFGLMRCDDVALKMLGFMRVLRFFIFVLVRSQNAAFGSFVSQMLVRTLVW